MSSLMTRICWVTACSNLAIHNMITLTYKNPTIDPELAKQQDLQDSNLLDRALYNHRANSLLLGMLGIITEVADRTYEPMVRRRAPQFICFSLLLNALLFQSYGVYGIVILRDHSRIGGLKDQAEIGDGLQTLAAAKINMAQQQRILSFLEAQPHIRLQAIQAHFPELDMVRILTDLIIESKVIQVKATFRLPYNYVMPDVVPKNKQIKKRLRKERLKQVVK